MHSIGITHRDIKPENILVGKDYVVKVIDFGCSLQDNVDIDIIHHLAGTLSFLPPEVVKERLCKRPFEPADIWALGLVVVEALTGHNPYCYFHSVNATFRGICMLDVSIDALECSEICKDFLYLCLCRNPEERATAKDLLKHPFLELWKQ
jgi:serine/threonine protein kinase